ncbi:hypothetical protein [Hippea maritima]|uniref:Uncharacterized protein n=1 Tax=Hippea maritima (strain ATCC 700847 / DSM 10411 / MH2) TaxID=760142 RepID=F2LV64_HIPMA|nr:hypothetical protein [Hippea maritima]AEA33648.1 hypothetical protein Hipma_0678 [Hippea maritima DSM 10411]
MRIFFSCSDKVCESLEKLLKAHGLKALFMKNLIEALKNEKGEIPEEHILAVLMNKFSVSFNEEVKRDNAGKRKELSELDELTEIAKGFE